MNSLPVHPAIVHFPIAVFIIIILLAFISIFTENLFLKRMILWLYIIGIISAIAAIVTGLYEANTIPHDEAIHEIMEKHEANAYITTGFYIVMFLWFLIRSRIPGRTEYVIWVILMFLGFFFLAYQNYLGGEMVYGHGAAVKPMEKIFEQEESSEHHHH